MEKKKYFAQTTNCNPQKHKAKYFDSQVEAFEWLSQFPSGGTVKIRTKKGWVELAHAETARKGKEEIMNKDKRYDKMSEEEILADARVKAWEDAAFFGKQLVMLGRIPCISLKNHNNVPFAFKVTCINGKEIGSFPFRNPLKK